MSLAIIYLFIAEICHILDTLISYKHANNDEKEVSLLMVASSLCLPKRAEPLNSPTLGPDSAARADT